MTPRTRMLIFVAFIVIILGVVAAFVLPGLTGGDSDDNTATTGGGEGVGQVASPEPGVTPTDTQPPIVLGSIVVAVQNLRRGQVIPPDAIALREWPIEAIPQNAVTSIEAVQGQRARQDIYIEQPILTSMYVPNLSDLSAEGSDLSASIPDTLRAIAVPMDRLTSVAYGIQRGDRVDVIVSMLFVEIDEEFQSALPNDVTIVDVTEEGIVVVSDLRGRREEILFPSASGGLEAYPAFVEPSEEPRPRLSTQMTVQNALVVGVGDFPADGILFGEPPTPTPEVIEDAEAPPSQQQQQQAAAAPTAQPERPDIITLAVSPQDAVIMTYLVEARIPITFALRAAADTSRVGTTPVTLSYILDEYDIVLPDALEYSIEPAIRSIRQLIAGDSISLDGN